MERAQALTGVAIIHGASTVSVSTDRMRLAKDQRIKAGQHVGPELCSNSSLGSEIRTANAQERRVGGGSKAHDTGGLQRLIQIQPVAKVHFAQRMASSTPQSRCLDASVKIGVAKTQSTRVLS